MTRSQREQTKKCGG